MKIVYVIFLGLAVECLPVYPDEFFSDIPGDGVITCGPNVSFQPVCPGGVGTVNVLSGALTGVLQQGGSTIGIDLARTAAFLSFAATPPNPNNPPDYNPQWLGPLGLNPRFQPSASNVGEVGLPPNLPPSMAYFDATVPLAGQEIRLNVSSRSAWRALFPIPETGLGPCQLWHGRTERDPASHNRFFSGAVMPARKPGSGPLGGFPFGGRPLVLTPVESFLNRSATGPVSLF